MSLPRESLDRAALAVRRVLTDKRFDHLFFGGYELVIMGCPRGTKDVDVVVKKPFLDGFNKVKQAFVDDSEFAVLDGTRTDAIRAIHLPSGVGIDILLWDLPKDPLHFSNDPHNFPVFSATHLFFRKIECLAKRDKVNDVTDIAVLCENFALDWKMINRKVAATQWREEALRKHSRNARVVEILGSLESG